MYVHPFKFRNIPSLTLRIQSQVRLPHRAPLESPSFNRAIGDVPQKVILASVHSEISKTNLEGITRRNCWTS
jgi:hypothetical protein